MANAAAAEEAAEVVPAAEDPQEMPIPTDPKDIFLGGLFAIALLATAYIASEIVLPLAFAIILNLLLQPALRLLERWHVPRILAALLLILALFGTIIALGAASRGQPGTCWRPSTRGHPSLQERLNFVRAPIEHCNGSCNRWKIWGAAPLPPPCRSSDAPHETVHGNAGLREWPVHDGIVSIFSFDFRRYIPASPGRFATLPQQAPGG